MTAPEWTEWRRPGPTGEQQWRDVGVGLGIVVGGVATAVLINSMGAFSFGTAPSLAEQVAWAAVLTVPLIWRRQFPVAVVVVIGVLFIVAQARRNGDNFVPSVALFIALYTLGAWGQNRVVARWVRLGVIGAMFAWLGYSFVQALVQPPAEFEGAAGPLDPVLATVIYQVAFNVAFFVSGYHFGNAAWLSARRRHELEVQADELRRSQELNARQAVVTERVRIARDLHDVVAHHVAVMGVQAGAARRVLDTDADVARGALETVEQTARTAITELRGLVGVLREEPTGDATAPAELPTLGASHPASPGLDQLPELADDTRSAGIEVAYAVYGDPRPVPDAVAVSAYRVVQESLTNVVKHAGGSAADVRVRFLDHGLELEVSDDGRGRSASRAAAGASNGAGFGLVGMRERVAVHGGEFEAGPRRDGGFRVRAHFPLGEAGRAHDAVGSSHEPAQGPR
ncbi:MAG TPA: sensor histidine kinase [Jiangellaceae bacterium]